MRYPEYKSWQPYVDTDRDGMPDVKMSDVVGEWIFEYDGGSVTPIPGNEEEG